MFLTAVFKLRTNDHDRALLDAAMARWSTVINEAMARARRDQHQLLKAIVMWTSPDGKRQKLVVNPDRLHAFALDCCRDLDYPLHSSHKTSLIVAVQEQLAGWLGLYLDWVAGGRKATKPSFPTLPPASPAANLARWETALEQSRTLMTLTEENRWRADVTRAARGRLLPQYFGACAAGGKNGLAHCGFLKRADRRYFALLTLWGEGDPKGAPTRRARNRLDAGPVGNIREPARPFWPTERQLAGYARGREEIERAKAAIMVPLMYGTGPGRRRKRWEHLFLKGTPKTAELVKKEGEFFLHVAFDLPEPPRRPMSGAVLAIRRGVNTLLAAVVLDQHGRVQTRIAIDGRQLARTIAAIQAVRRTKQQKGTPTKGDRKASRIAEHLLYSAAHQIIDLACRHGASIVLLEDPSARKPQPFLAYKHFHRLTEILGYLTIEAGLPPPKEERVYGKWQTCLQCGWVPGDPVRHVEAAEGECPGCRRVRDPEYDLAELLALDTLRLTSIRGEKDAERRAKLKAELPSLAEWTRARRV